MRRICTPLVFVASLMFSPMSIAETQEVFFPSEVWEKTAMTERDEGLIALYERWFGGQLRAMNERSLSSSEMPTGVQNTIRLLFLPTFLPAGMIRLEYGEDTAPVHTYKRLNGAGGYEPGILKAEIAGAVSDADLQTIMSLVKKISPWAETTAPDIDPQGVTCADGIQIVFEFRSGGDYKVLSRHECELDQNSSIRQLVREFDSLADGMLLWPKGFDPY